jgi:hypothetical protein
VHAGLAGVAMIAAGLTIASTTPARAQIPPEKKLTEQEIARELESRFREMDRPKIESLLRDRRACWQSEYYNIFKLRWADGKESRTGAELHGLIKDDQYNEVFNPGGYTGLRFKFSEGIKYIEITLYSPPSAEGQRVYRWHRVPCPGEPAAEPQPTLPALEQSSPQPKRPAEQTAYGGPFGFPTVTATVDVVNAHSEWTITSPIDQVKTKSDTPEVRFTGQINWGPFYISGAAMGAGNARGSFSDTFIAFPAAATGTVTSGLNTSFTTSGGVIVTVAPGLKVGPFAVYYSDLEALYGTTGLSGSASFSLLETHSQAAGGGLIVNDAFAVGNVPFLFSGSIAALADNVKSGMFDGNGSGWQANAMLTFPLGPVRGNLYAQYTDINASGNVLGSPLTFDNRTWQFGGGVTAAFSFEPDNSRRFGAR